MRPAPRASTRRREPLALHDFGRRSVFRPGRCAVRAASAVRRRGRPIRARRATALRGPGPFGARHPCAALDPDRAHLRPGEPQADLLPVDGVPDRPVADQQRHQSTAASAHREGRRARAASTGSAWSSRSPMPGWAMAASAGWRRASSTRWRPCSFRRWATGCATSTACSASRSRAAGSASSRTTGCAGRIPGKSPRRSEAVEVRLGCSLRVASGHPADRP